MSTHVEELAYVSGRIEKSKALASATNSMSARASHEGIVKAYEKRLAALMGVTVPAKTTDVEQLGVSQRRYGPVGAGG